MHYLKGGGRLELVVTSARSVSSSVSVVIDVEMFLRTRFLMFLCGNDLITRTGSVIVSWSWSMSLQMRTRIKDHLLLLIIFFQCMVKFV